jgi:hypothetical protein
MISQIIIIHSYALPFVFSKKPSVVGEVAAIARIEEKKTTDPEIRDEEGDGGDRERRGG